MKYVIVARTRQLGTLIFGPFDEAQDAKDEIAGVLLAYGGTVELAQQWPVGTRF